MLKKNIKKVFVVDRNGILLGIVYEREVFSFMNNSILNTGLTWAKLTT
jgi:hypothetical protein